MTVGRICSRVVETVRPEHSVAEAARHMLEQNVGSLLVQDADGRLVGIVTDRDLALEVVGQDRESSSTQVAEVMTENLQTILEEAPIEEALAVMRANATRRLPVVGKRGELVGILALDDVLALLAEELGAIGALLDQESPRRLVGHAVPERVSPERAPVVPPRRAHEALPPAAVPGRIERTLEEIRDSLDVVACALSIGLQVRLLGGGVIEGDVRQAADRRLERILARKPGGGRSGESQQS